jgi:hypothetical protein
VQALEKEKASILENLDLLKDQYKVLEEEWGSQVRRHAVERSISKSGPGDPFSLFSFPMGLTMCPCGVGGQLASIRKDYDTLKGRYVNDTVESQNTGRSMVFVELLATVDDFERAKVRPFSETLVEGLDGGRAGD